jgi:hypothetical protein
MFQCLFDCMLEYAIAYPAKGQVPRRPPGLPPQHLAQTRRGPGPQGDLPNADVERLLAARRARTARHPLYTWLTSERSIPAQDRLAILLPAWAMGIMGYRDLCLHTLRHHDNGGLARTVSTWAEMLAGHSAVFVADWDALRMDARLGWTASETLRWCYLDPGVDVHRRNMARFVTLAARCDSPLMSLWLMAALEASGEGWFTTLRYLAEQAEQDLGAPLDYLAGRCEGPGPDGGRFRQQPLTAAQASQVQHMITAVFDALDEQLSLTLASAHPR